MLVHSVFFWLKPELTEAQRADFRRAVDGLGAIESVRHSWVGTPSATERRPAVDHTFSLAFTRVALGSNRKSSATSSIRNAGG